MFLILFMILSLVWMAGWIMFRATGALIHILVILEGTWGRCLAVGRRLRAERTASIALILGEDAMRYVTKIAVLLPALLLAASGCATKDWVQQLTDRKEGEINQRMDKKEGGINQRMDGLSGQVRETGEGVKGARDRADSAMNKAEGAEADALREESRLNRLLGEPLQREAREDSRCLFRLRQGGSLG